MQDRKMTDQINQTLVLTNELNHRSTVPVEMMKFKYQLELLVNLQVSLLKSLPRRGEQITGKGLK